MIIKFLKNATVKNASWLIMGKVAQMAISLIVGVLTARYLGPSNYGLINYASAYTAFFKYGNQHIPVVFTSKLKVFVFDFYFKLFQFINLFSLFNKIIELRFWHKRISRQINNCFLLLYVKLEIQNFTAFQYACKIIHDGNLVKNV